VLFVQLAQLVQVRRIWLVTAVLVACANAVVLADMLVVIGSLRREGGNQHITALLWFCCRDSCCMPLLLTCKTPLWQSAHHSVVVVVLSWPLLRAFAADAGAAAAAAVG
jgi:hypothetical protein